MEVLTASKFKVGDRVRIIAWCVPGVRSPSPVHLVLGKTGTIKKYRAHAASDSADGPYDVYVDQAHESWWFRACDLVPLDSDCSCDNGSRGTNVGDCIIHDRPDPDPSVEVAARLTALVHDLEDHLTCRACDGGGYYIDREGDDRECSKCNGTGRKS